MQAIDQDGSGEHLAAQMGSRLQEERLRLGFTQTSLAEALGISRTSATLYEAGKHAPRVDVLVAMDGLGVDVCFLLTGRRTTETSVDEESLGFALEEALRQSGKSADVGGMRGLLKRAWPIYLGLKRYRDAKAHAAYCGAGSV